MYVRLEAEARQERITDIGLGFGNIEELEAKRLLMNLSRLAGVEPKKATPADLRGTGIAFRIESRGGGEG